MRGGEAVLVGRLEGIVAAAQFVADPAGHVDAEPFEEVEGLLRAAQRQREDEARRSDAPLGAGVGVVADRVLRLAGVVDDLADEEGRTRLLFAQQPFVLGCRARVAFGDDDPAERHVLVLGGEVDGARQTRPHRLVGRTGADEDGRVTLAA